MLAHRSTLVRLLMTGTICLGTGCAEQEQPIRRAMVYVAAGEDASSVFAGFFGDAFGATSCVASVADRCVVTTCLDGGGVQTYVNGGEVELKGEGDLEVTLDTGAVENANGKTGPGLATAYGLPPLSENETVTITARGHTSSVKLPERLTLEEPRLDSTSCQPGRLQDGAPTVIDASDDFKAEWSSGGDEDVDIVFTFDDIKDYVGDEDRERSTIIQCSYTADEGAAKVPNEVVEAMPRGPGTFTIRQIVKDAELIDDWSVTFGAYWERCGPVDVD